MNNKAYIIGTVGSDMVFSHTTGGEKFNEFVINVKRDSGYVDNLKCIISEKIVVGIDISEGTRVEIEGQYRSFSRRRDDGSRDNQLFIFVNDIKTCEEDNGEDVNDIELNGEIVRCYNCRHTKTGRNVTDFVMCVPREYSRVDYLNCIAWGRDAKFLGKMKDSINREDSITAKVRGRLQSRVFTKFYDDGSKEDREIYELSVNDLSVDFDKGSENPDVSGVEEVEED